RRAASLSSKPGSAVGLWAKDYSLFGSRPYRWRLRISPTSFRTISIAVPQTTIDKLRPLSGSPLSPLSGSRWPAVADRLLQEQADVLCEHVGPGSAAARRCVRTA